MPRKKSTFEYKGTRWIKRTEGEKSKRVGIQEVYQSIGGYQAFGFSQSDSGRWYQKGVRGSVSREHVLNTIAEALHADPNSRSFKKLVKQDVGDIRSGGDPDLLFWNRLKHTMAEAGIPEAGKFSTEKGKKPRRYTKKFREALQYKAFMESTKDYWIGKDKREIGKAIKSIYGVSTMTEAFNKWKENDLSSKFIDAVMKLDVEMLKKFGLDDAEIAALRSASEYDRYRFAMDNISMSDIRIVEV